jgi:hypothetical protein
MTIVDQALALAGHVAILANYGHGMTRESFTALQAWLHT